MYIFSFYMLSQLIPVILYNCIIDFNNYHFSLSVFNVLNLKMLQSANYFNL